MKKIFLFLRHRLWPATAIAVLTVMTLSTSVMGIAKLSKSFSIQNPKIKEIQTIEAKEKEIKKITVANAASTKISPTLTLVLISPTLTPTHLTINQNLNKNLNISPTALPSQQTNSNTFCIITLFGKQYDVTKLQLTHSGGNIFQCGTDMTNIYQKQHGTNMARMQQYLLVSSQDQRQNQNSSPNNNNVSPIPSPKPTGKYYRREDKKDDKHSDKIEYDDDEYDF